MIKLNIEGMTCNHCVKAVTQALSEVPGVTRVVKVDLDSRQATVEGTPDPQALVAAVAEEGYQARVVA